MMSLLVTLYGDRISESGKNGTGRGRWVPKGTNKMAISGLSYRKALVGTVRVTSGKEGQAISPCGSSISSYQGLFLVMPG